MERKKVKKSRYISPTFYSIHSSRTAGVANTVYVNFLLTTTAIIYCLLLSSTLVNSGKNFNFNNYTLLSITTGLTYSLKLRVTSKLHCIIQNFYVNITFLDFFILHNSIASNLSYSCYKIVIQIKNNDKHIKCH